MDVIDKIIKNYLKGIYLHNSDVFKAIESLRPDIKSDRDKLLIELGEIIVSSGFVFSVALRRTREYKLEVKMQELIQQIKEQEQK